ncbi:type II secretion system protein [Janthinobacterium fluminis]|uniref:Type II secretion system protein n=1 Tax=Janthinobacterium fluminis TaxID=2987524 RepID=A0ABT5JY31_9BURK|nr:type II secretion system protein [Janthinobacterium fluminis]MDC8757638.1 type II secretion system protein [Janthinobacterium fluminis]
MPSAPRRQQGFTYLGLLILVAIIGLVGAAGLKMGALLQRSAAERELLDIGAAFADALDSYARVTPAGQPRQPAALKDLLRDPRFPGTLRHLRKLYVDPMTGRAEWGLLHPPGGNGIVGVHSLSPARPVKVGNFDARFQGFEDKLRLSDWVFMASGGLAGAAAPGADLPAVPPLPPAPAEPPAPPDAPPEPEPEAEPEPAATPQPVSAE